MGTTQEIEAYDRPWGWYQVVYADDNYWTKILWVSPGQALSLQYHESRTEYWMPLDLGAKAIVNGCGTIDLLVGVQYTVSPRLLHRIYNPTQSVVRIVEVATGKPQEDDIVRVSDKYGR